MFLIKKNYLLILFSGCLFVNLFSNMLSQKQHTKIKKTFFIPNRNVNFNIIENDIKTDEFNYAFYQDYEEGKIITKINFEKFQNQLLKIIKQKISENNELFDIKKITGKIYYKAINKKQIDVMVQLKNDHWLKKINSYNSFFSIFFD